MPQLIIYTDGASRGNPGPGGFGAILMFGDKRKEISQGFRYTTNNRMELLAVIVSLESLTKKENFCQFSAINPKLTFLPGPKEYASAILIVFRTFERTDFRSSRFNYFIARLL